MKIESNLISPVVAEVLATELGVIHEKLKDTTAYHTMDDGARKDINEVIGRIATLTNILPAFHAKEELEFDQEKCDQLYKMSCAHNTNCADYCDMTCRYRRKIDKPRIDIDDRPACCIDHGVFGGTCDTCKHSLEYVDDGR